MPKPVHESKVKLTKKQVLETEHLRLQIVDRGYRGYVQKRDVYLQTDQDDKGRGGPGWQLLLYLCDTGVTHAEMLANWFEAQGVEVLRITTPPLVLTEPLPKRTGGGERLL